MIAHQRPQRKVDPREGHPVSVRFGGRDPRLPAFGELIIGMDLDDEPWRINRAIAKLAGLGYQVTLTEASENPPTLPVMTAHERAAYARGEWLPWMDPKHIAEPDA